MRSDLRKMSTILYSSSVNSTSVTLPRIPDETSNPMDSPSASAWNYPSCHVWVFGMRMRRRSFLPSRRLMPK